MICINSVILLLFHILTSCLQIDVALSHWFVNRDVSVVITVILSTSSIITNIISMIWAYTTMDFKDKRVGEFICVALHFLQLGTVWRFAKLILTGDFNDKTEFNTLRLLQVCLQDASLVIVQLYLLLEDEGNQNLSVMSVSALVITTLSVLYTFIMIQALQQDSEQYSIETLQKSMNCELYSVKTMPAFKQDCEQQVVKSLQKSMNCGQDSIKELSTVKQDYEQHNIEALQESMKGEQQWSDISQVLMKNQNYNIKDCIKISQNQDYIHAQNHIKSQSISIKQKEYCDENTGKMLQKLAYSDNLCFQQYDRKNPHDLQNSWETNISQNNDLQMSNSVLMDNTYITEPNVNGLSSESAESVLFSSPILVENQAISRTNCHLHPYPINALLKSNNSDQDIVKAFRKSTNSCDSYQDPDKAYQKSTEFETLSVQATSAVNLSPRSKQSKLSSSNAQCPANGTPLQYRSESIHPLPKLPNKSKPLLRLLLYSLRYLFNLQARFLSLTLLVIAVKVFTLLFIGGHFLILAGIVILSNNGVRPFAQIKHRKSNFKTKIYDFACLYELTSQPSCMCGRYICWCYIIICVENVLFCLVLLISQGGGRRNLILLIYVIICQMAGVITVILTRKVKMCKLYDLSVNNERVCMRGVNQANLHPTEEGEECAPHHPPLDNRAIDFDLDFDTVIEYMGTDMHNAISLIESSPREATPELHTPETRVNLQHNQVHIAENKVEMVHNDLGNHTFQDNDSRPLTSPSVESHANTHSHMQVLLTTDHEVSSNSRNTNTLDTSESGTTEHIQTKMQLTNNLHKDCNLDINANRKPLTRSTSYRLKRYLQKRLKRKCKVHDKGRDRNSSWRSRVNYSLRQTKQSLCKALRIKNRVLHFPTRGQRSNNFKMPQLWGIDNKDMNWDTGTDSSSLDSYWLPGRGDHKGVTGCYNGPYPDCETCSLSCTTCLSCFSDLTDSLPDSMWTWPPGRGIKTTGPPGRGISVADLDSLPQKKLSSREHVNHWLKTLHLDMEPVQVDDSLIIDYDGSITVITNPEEITA